MKVSLMPGIAALSGKYSDNLYFRTLKSGRTIAYFKPNNNVRNKPLTPNQKRFGQVAKQVTRILHDPEQSTIFQLAHIQHGKPNESLRSFVFRQLWSLQKTLLHAYESNE